MDSQARAWLGDIEAGLGSATESAAARSTGKTRMAATVLVSQLRSGSAIASGTGAVLVAAAGILRSLPARLGSWPAVAPETAPPDERSPGATNTALVRAGHWQGEKEAANESWAAGQRCVNVNARYAPESLRAGSVVARGTMLYRQRCRSLNENENEKKRKTFARPRAGMGENCCCFVAANDISTFQD